MARRKSFLGKMFKEMAKDAERQGKAKIRQQNKEAKERAEQQQRLEKEKERLTKKHNALIEQAQQAIKIAEESTELVNTTVDPAVFFSRYKLLIKQTEKLVELANDITFTGDPREQLQTFKDSFVSATNDFIDRSYNAAMEKAAELKTEKGRENARNRYFTKMEKYFEEMDVESVDYFYMLQDKHNKGETQ